MKRSDETGPAAAADSPAIAGQIVSAPLGAILYVIAREQADEQMESADHGVWAGLIRDAGTAADLVPKTALNGEAGVRHGPIEADELSELRGSAGLIATLDSAGATAVRAFLTEEELAAAWSAILVELNPPRKGA